MQTADEIIGLWVGTTAMRLRVCSACMRLPCTERVGPAADNDDDAGIRVLLPPLVVSYPRHRSRIDHASAPACILNLKKHVEMRA